MPNVKVVLIIKHHLLQIKFYLAAPYGGKRNHYNSAEIQNNSFIKVVALEFHFRYGRKSIKTKKRSYGLVFRSITKVIIFTVRAHKKLNWLKQEYGLVPDKCSAFCCGIAKNMH